MDQERRIQPVLEFRVIGFLEIEIFILSMYHEVFLHLLTVGEFSCTLAIMIALFFVYT